MRSRIEHAGLIVAAGARGRRGAAAVRLLKGHPVRIRYDVPLVAAAAAITGVGIGLLPRRVRAAAGIAVVALAVWQAPPFDTGRRRREGITARCAQRGGPARGHGLPGVALGSASRS